MATLQQLRASAKGLGLPASVIRSATSAEELSALIMTHINGNAPAKPARKQAVKKTTAPKKSTTRTSPRKSSPAVKSTQGKVKRTTTVSDESGRHLLGKVNFSLTENWNPRPGSPPDLIVKALRKFKGDREKVFQALKPTIKNFVKPRMNDGTVRTKESREDMLRYRISRTAWDFAMKTGQHEKSENRAEYGSRTSTKPVRKAPPARKPTTARKPVAKPVAKKRGRPVKKKTTARR